MVRPAAGSEPKVKNSLTNRVSRRSNSSKARSRGRLGRRTMAMIEAGRDVLILKRASASRSSRHWSDDDFDVLADGAVVGRIFKANAAPVGSPCMWTLVFPHHKGRLLTHGDEATREAAMAAFAKSWRRE
jgi:hypothetical protein